MYVDALGLLSDAQAFSATGFSTNTIDLTLPTVPRDIGDGEPLVMAVGVDVSADAGTGDETYVFEFVQSANANLSSPDVLISRTIARTALLAGTIHYIPIPPGALTKRYIGARLTLGGTTPSITVTIFIIPQSMIDRFKAYAKGYVVN